MASWRSQSEPTGGLGLKFATMRGVACVLFFALSSSGECCKSGVEIPMSYKTWRCDQASFLCDADGDGVRGCCCKAGYEANATGHCEECGYAVSWRCMSAMVVASGASVAAVPAILAMAGFTSAGISAGSLAAMWQASMGGVASGGLFSTLQSISMAGLGWGGTFSIGGAAGSAAMGFCKAVDAMMAGEFSEVERFLDNRGLTDVRKAIVKASGATSLEDLKQLDTEGVHQIVIDAGLNAVQASKLRRALKLLKS